MIIQRKICLVLLLPSLPSSAQPAPLVLYLRFPSCFHELDHDCCIFTLINMLYLRFPCCFHDHDHKCCIFTLITMITKIQDGNFFQSGSFRQIHKFMSFAITIANTYKIIFIDNVYHYINQNSNFVLFPRHHHLPLPGMETFFHGTAHCCPIVVRDGFRYWVM